MDFDFSPEQRVLAQTARDLFAKESPPTRLHDIARGADRGEKIWAAMEAAGLTTLATDGDETDWVLVLEEAGRAALPEPLVEAMAVAPRAAERGALAAAAVLNGVSMRLLEMSVDHAKQRHQFGRPIGSFQAVKHTLATMQTLLDSARPAAWYAAYALARDLPGAEIAARVAKVEAVRAHETINREALQVHGGIGFTWEHDLHLWLRRGIEVASMYGTAAEHRARIAESIFEEGTDA